MTNYEITFIVRPDMEEAEINKTAEELKDVLTSKGAKIVSEKAMGQRELAYEIKKFKSGYYFLYVVEASKEAIDEFDHVVSINENLLRHLVIRTNEND